MVANDLIQAIIDLSDDTGTCSKTLLEAHTEPLLNAGFAGLLRAMKLLGEDSERVWIIHPVG